MKIVFNKIIPFKGFTAINLFGVLFMRDKEALTTRLVQHEKIHTAQMRELGYIGFYIIYLFEWIYRLIFHTKTAYSGISFEREASICEVIPNYLEWRPSFAQWKIFKSL